MKKALIVLTSLVSFSFANAKGLKIDIGQAGSKKSSVAFAPITGTSRLSKSILRSKIIKNLEFSTYFKEIKVQGLNVVNKSLSREQAKSLADQGIEFLIAANTLSSGAKELIQFRVYFLKKYKLALDKFYVKRASEVSSIANEFSDDFMQALTGKKSIFNTKIAVTSDRVGNGWKELYVMNWDGSGIKRVSYHKASTLSPNWSAPGNQIVYSAITVQPRSGVRNANLYIYDFRNKRRSLLSSRPGINSGGAFFPNGRALVMTLTQGGVPDLFKIGLNGKILDRLTKGPGRTMNVEASISPDGNEVAFSSDRSGRPMLYRMSLNNKVPQRLTIAGRYNSAPSWSPDGKKLVFAGWDKGHFDVFMINTDGTNLKRITEKRARNGRWSNNESPSFSPDGRFISFISNRSGKKQVYLIRSDGSNITKLTSNKHNYFHAKWSPYLK